MAMNRMNQLRLGHRALRVYRRPGHSYARTASTATAASSKPEGDISAAFASLSGISFEPLEPRFADVKARLAAGHEDALHASWNRLLRSLRDEIPTIAEKKSRIIPEIAFENLSDASTEFISEHRKRGVAVIRNVIPQQEVLDMKRELQEYIKANPQTKAFPAERPQVYELYWSPSQIKARTHPNLIEAQKFLMQFWHSRDPHALVSTQHPTVYADRLRMRLPGDAKFALGPHVDGGSCERWEEDGYGRGQVYDAVWRGKWEEYDPWESSSRLPVVSDKYAGVGACSMFRMFQGWLSMSETGAYEGTLLVGPLLKQATAYFLLRPFFEFKQPPVNPDSFDDTFLAPENWRFNASNSWLHGATPGHGQELRPFLHPHLNLSSLMVHVPRVNPGDYVSWHCDSIHAVDSVHQGKSDSSVMYIPTCPLTIRNAEFLAQQRECFLNGSPSPDFGGGVGESHHIGRASVDDVEKVNPVEGMQAFGLQAFDADSSMLKPGQKDLLSRANKILGFDD